MSESVLGRLLDEISWEGSNVKRYREGGRGMENVLSAEVLQALDLLPREAFLGAVLCGAHGAVYARARVAAEAEELAVTALGNHVVLTEAGVVVQPDGWLSGPTTLTLVEAKGPKGSPFSPDQLSREYQALNQMAAGRVPVMLLVLPKPPPVRVEGRGPCDPVAELGRQLADAATPLGDHPTARDPSAARAHAVLAWTTWAEIAAATERALASVVIADPSTAATIRRIGDGLLRAIAFHTQP